MIAFTDDHRGEHGVVPICKVLPIALSTYYERLAKREDPSRQSNRAQRDAELRLEIRRVFDENFQAYGARKVWRQMRREGFEVARCTVERLMATLSLAGVRRGRPVKTTTPHTAAPCPLREFWAPAPNRLWVSVFTYVATWQGFVYVAFVIDAFARRIVGWRVSRTAHAGFVLDALVQAVHQRRPAKGGRLIHHSDSQCVPSALLIGLTLVATGRLAWLAPQGASSRCDPHSDRPRAVSFLGPVGRPRRLAARFRLAGACDPRRA